MARTAASQSPTARSGPTARERTLTVVGDAAGQVRDGVADSVGAIGSHAPEALNASRRSAERGLTGLRQVPTHSLVLSTVFSGGLSAGMLLSRAPRTLVMLAFVPAVVLGGTLLERLSARIDDPPDQVQR